MDVFYGAWRPDVGGPKSGFAQRAEGVVPQAAANGLGYGPFPRLVTANGAEALSAEPRGQISVQSPSGSWSVFAATATTIEQLQSDFTWDDIETGRTIPAGDNVSFEVFGIYLISTDTISGMKAYNLSAGGTNDAISGAPAARFAFSVNNVLFGLGTSADPRRFFSSDIGNHTKWTGGVADAKTLEDGGGLIGGADLKNGRAVMLQERATRMIEFGIGQSAYAVSKVSDEVGCISASTIARADGRAVWWSSDGPWLMTADSAPVPIGAEKINRWAEESIGRQNYGSLQGVADPERKLFLWRIDESRLLAYSYLLNDFSIIPASTTAVARIATPAVKIDSLSGKIDDLAGTINSLGGGSAPVLGGLDLSRRFATFSGTPVAAVLETSIVDSETTGLVSWARPVDDAAAGTLAVGVSDRLDAALSWKTGVAKVADGRVPLRARGKNVAFRRSIPEGTDWSYANGVAGVRGSVGGPR